MKEKFLLYIQDRRHIAAIVCVILVLVGLVLLVFSPYRIHDWIEANRNTLMWVVVVLLITQSVLFANDASHWHNKYLLLSEAEKKDMQGQAEMYNFYDEKGELKLSIKPEMLYYLEAADNYVQIVYITGGKVEKMLIRNTLKNIEWRFRDKGLVRCHRSFIVNMNKVQVLRRKEGEVVLDFAEERIAPIPVSKGYGDKIMERFAS